MKMDHKRTLSPEKITFPAAGAADYPGNAITSSSHIGNLNPLRYRGYYYDSETGFYYLQSRYYDPAMKRFLNADGYVSTGQGIPGYNMFAYCGDNPVIGWDPTGAKCNWASPYTDAGGGNRNRRISTKVTINGAKHPQSDYGAAQEYIEVKGSEDRNGPNCYAFITGSSTKEQPGDASGRIPQDWSNVYDVGLSIKADYIAKGYTVRKLMGPDDKVYDNEYKIALRVGTTPLYDMLVTVYDYHLMIQTNTGQWAEKHGCENTSILWELGMTPETIRWTIDNLPYEYYDSAIIYYAIGRR